MDYGIYGQVTGVYNNRTVIWSITLTTHHRFIQTTSIKFALSNPGKIKIVTDKPFIKRAKHKLTIITENGSLIFMYYNLFLSKKKILNLLEKLSSMTEKFEKDNIDLCFNCGEKIKEDTKKCLKCDWLWE